MPIGFTLAMALILQQSEYSPPKNKFGALPLKKEEDRLGVFFESRNNPHIHFLLEN